MVGGMESTKFRLPLAVPGFYLTHITTIKLWKDHSPSLTDTKITELNIQNKTLR